MVISYPHVDGEGLLTEAASRDPRVNRVTSPAPQPAASTAAKPRTHLMEACALFMTTRRFCRATSVFCFTTVRLAPWPDRRASFSRLKLEIWACGEGRGYDFPG